MNISAIGLFIQCMELRPEKEIISLRPNIPTSLDSIFSDVELFQNQTLRQVIKLQHEVIMTLIDDNAHFYSILCRVKTEEEYIRELRPYIQSQSALKHTLIGVVVGMFSHDELQFYKKNQSELNKRIIQILIQRIGNTKFPTKRF